MFATGGVLGLNSEPWYEAGRKPLLKQSIPPGRDQAAVEHHKPRQVLGFAAQAIGDPGPVAGPALEPAAGVQEVIGTRVFGEIGDHRADDRQVVNPTGRRWGKRSLTGIPLSPYCRNFHGHLSTLPTLLN